jgi:murein L,D-transpeptidase YafK
MMRAGGMVRCWWLLLLLVGTSLPARGVEPGHEFWLLVDTRQQTLSLMHGTEVAKIYTDIAIGRFGTTTAKQARDGKTPLGEFRIDRITRDTSFQRFFSIDYPNLEHARAGLQSGRISQQEYGRIRGALRAQASPPQHTALGGFIGIHGLGEGDPAIHAAFNWTNGCIALSNEQIDDLAQWVVPGMQVIIR